MAENGNGTARAAASAARSGAETVQTVSSEFVLKKSRRFILWSLLGTLVIVLVAEIRKGNIPPHPKVFVGGGVVFFMLSMLVEVAPQLAKSLAVLIFLGVIFTRGEESFEAVQTAARRKPRKAGGGGGIARPV